MMLSACYERHVQPRESFTLRGNVSDCKTGAPVEGASIYAEASEKGNFGFFGTSKAEAGTATTDVNGNFEMLPYEYSFTYEFDIHAAKTGYYSGSSTIVYKDDILRSGARPYIVDSLCVTH